MKIYYGLDSFQHIPNAVVTSGTFDGVHFGHQVILKRLQEIAKNTGGNSVVITYWPHPRFVLFPEQTDLKLLSTLEEKAALLEKIDIDYLLVVDFTKEFSQLTSIEFIQKILVDKIGTKRLVIGYDHKFGRNREGSFEYLKANASNFGFSVEEIPKQELEQVAVSSTKIRKALLGHDVQTANEYLTSKYQLSGKVISGKKLGRTIGFPTANILVEGSYKLIPSEGVYAVNVIYKGEKFGGMLNIGVRPTVETGTSLQTVEVHIFDFNKDIYGEKISLEFLKHLREEQKFENLDALKKQLQEDKKQAIQVLK